MSKSKPAHAAAPMEREALPGAILETSPDGPITIDESGTITSFNPAPERMFGYRPGEVLGRNVACLMPSPYREAHDSYLVRYLLTGEKRIVGRGREVLGQRKDGGVFPLEPAVGEVRAEGHRLFRRLPARRQPAATPSSDCRSCRPS